MNRISKPVTMGMFVLVMLVILPTRSFGQIERNSLAQTPPMGWNSWNKFQCNVSAELIKTVADAIATNGMKDAGYEYVVIDDCWQVKRDAVGNIVADPERFPDGIKGVADYVHSKGLKFGVYSDAGTKTCAGRPASQGHEYQDALMYASWGVDYLKYDWCHTDTRNAQEAYTTMSNALLSTGRPIVFSMCEWGSNKPWLWGKGIGNLWRTTGDIGDHFKGGGKFPDGGCCELGMVDILDLQVGLESFSGPGHWNDPDMLEVGNGGMTTPEYRAHFSFWAMLAAPLMSGNDVRSMSADTKEILANKEVIAIDQDALGRQGRRIKKEGDLEVWGRPLRDGGRALIFFNRGAGDGEIGVTWEEIAYPGHLSAKVRDLWEHKELGSFTGSYKAKVAPHSVVMVKLLP